MQNIYDNSSHFIPTSELLLKNNKNKIKQKKKTKNRKKKPAYEEGERNKQIIMFTVSLIFIFIINSPTAWRILNRITLVVPVYF